MKDSKKFHSTKKIKHAADYIKEHSISWSVTWSDFDTIDNINIRQATLKSMHSAIQAVANSIDIANNIDKTLLLIDRNDFKPYLMFDDTTQSQVAVPYTCIEGGDNKYTAIAAASILAKTERDKYIEEMCETYPKLDELYGLASHKGYGTKKHLEAIRNNGISPWHRKSFGICKSSKINDIFL